MIIHIGDIQVDHTHQDEMWELKQPPLTPSVLGGQDKVYQTNNI